MFGTLVARALSLADELGAGLGEVNGLALDGHTLASLVDVGKEEIREAIEAALGVCGVAIGLVVRCLVVRLVVVLLLGVLLIEHRLGGLLGLTVSGTTNGDHSTVHVHLAVADLVEPGPSK